MQVFANKPIGGGYMFESLEKNKIMILGAYKKLKTYYYYDKSILYNKMRLATWEHPKDDMNHRINDLANFMYSLETSVDNDYLSMLLKQISLIPMPKSFVEKNGAEEVIQNIPVNKKLSQINFFIKAPVELLILDTIWALMISKIAYDQNCVPSDLYANQIKTRQVFNNNIDLFEGINFNSNRLFYPYFGQYSSWLDNAFKTIKRRYESNKDSILIALDIKSYYYSATFNYDQLHYFLNNDNRIKNIECLTNIIETIYISYTAEMQKFRGNIPADCKKSQSAFPIGLISSMILANLYLKDFDDAIRTKVKPAYYGRYVDDIILVVNKTEDISRDYIIEKTLVNNDIVESSKNSYRFLLPKGDLWIQKDKIRCVYFDHNEPDAMIKLLCKASDLKPSMSDGFLMPDLDLSEKNFDECAYSIKQDKGTLKVRNFMFSTNNYEASLFLNDLIRASKNVNVQERNHRNYIERQLKQILRFYKSLQAIEYRSAWTNIMNLMLINQRYDYFLEFYNNTYDAIDSISENLVEYIVPSKLDYILNQLKENLREQLAISASIALAPHALKQIKFELSQSAAKNDACAFLNELKMIFENARDIRNANMFNNHMLAFPLLSYIGNVDENISLVTIDPQDIRKLCNTRSLNKTKVDFSPKFIHLDELYLLRFMFDFSDGGNPFKGKISEINRYFIDINNIDKRLNTISEFDNPINESNSLQGVNISESSRVNKKIKLALASILIDEKVDVIPVLKNPSHNLSPSKKNELYKMLNEAKIKQAKIIIFPEFFMPIQWLEEVLAFSRKNRIAIVSGLRYLAYGDQAYNYITVLQPFSDDFFKYSIPLFREKNHYAPAEKIEVAKSRLLCKDPKGKSTHLINWNGLNYSNLMCYELTNIEYRFALRGLINLLIVPELNKDTNYFSNIVESTTRDLHSFVVQVNTSKYGDSRITGPYNSLFKDIIKLKGGKDNILLTGEIDINEIGTVRNTYLQKLNEKIYKAFAGELEEKEPDKRKPKDPSAGFRKEAKI